MRERERTGRSGAFVDEQIHWNLMVEAIAAQVHQVQTAERKVAARAGISAHPTAQHVFHALVVAVLIVDVELRVGDQSEDRTLMPYPRFGSSHL